MTTCRNVTSMVRSVLLLAVAATMTGCTGPSSRGGEAPVEMTALSDRSMTVVDTTEASPPRDAGSTLPPERGVPTSASIDSDAPIAPVSSPSAPSSSVADPSTPSSSLDGDCGWSSAPVATAGWPSSLPTTGYPRLVDADIGAHEGYDRFVLDFVDTGDLADSVGWIDGGPRTDGEGAPIPMDGAAFLEVRVVGFAFWMLEPTEWYDGPDDLSGPSRGLVNVRQATMTGDFEGYVTWHLGADRVAPFRVFTLEAPSRLVVDVCSTPDR